MSDYIPIDCHLYSRYELAIMHRQLLRVVWRAHDRLIHLEALLPINLKTRKHAEYLIVKTKSGARLEVRLDRILRAEPCRGDCL